MTYLVISCRACGGIASHPCPNCGGRGVIPPDENPHREDWPNDPLCGGAGRIPCRACGETGLEKSVLYRENDE